MHPCVLQIRTDPKAIPKLSALLFKLRSVMTPSLTGLTALGVDNADAAAAEVVTHFTRGLLHLAQSVLKVMILFHVRIDDVYIFCVYTCFFHKCT